jgi:L-2-hydroxyglutarate oxidase LhgO
LVAQDFDADLVVVGAGAVGLAVAARLATTRSVVVIEARESFGLETTSHNTGIIHAGLFYETGSAKHRLCLEGNALLYHWCEAHEVPHRRTGKLMVAMIAEELPALERLAARAEANGVPGIERLTAEQARALEPLVPAVAALYSESSGVIDQYTYARSLAAAAQGAGAMLVYQHRVTAASREEGGFRIELTDTDGARSELRCAAVVNAAGHGAPAVGAALGYPLDGDDASPSLRQRVNRGRYFDLVGPDVVRAVSRPIYPMPRGEGSVIGHQAQAGGLGLHLSVDVDGTTHLGPDTTWLDDGAPLDYRNDDSERAAFLAAGRRLLPSLRDEDLAPGQVGYRPKLALNGRSNPNAPPDFLIWSDRGYVHLGGIESPGLTSSLAIAREVESLL